MSIAAVATSLQSVVDKIGNDGSDIPEKRTYAQIYDEYQNADKEYKDAKQKWKKNKSDKSRKSDCFLWKGATVTLKAELAQVIARRRKEMNMDDHDNLTISDSEEE